jgi:C1A family cysteine protease
MNSMKIDFIRVMNKKMIPIPYTPDKERIAAMDLHIDRMDETLLSFINAKGDLLKAVNPKANKNTPINNKTNIIPIVNPKLIRKIVDLRNKMPPIVDQGSLGSCTACALCGIVSYLNPKITGSRLFLYYNERVMIGTINIDSGAYIRDGVTSLTKMGICPESMWPYIIPNFKTKPPINCYKKAMDSQVLTSKNIYNNTTDMMSALNAGHPFVVGIMVYSSFMTLSVARTGMVPMPKKGESILGGHAVVVCGYDDNKKLWICRNSWGTNWGEKGYFYLPYNYLLDSRLSSDLWCLLSIEK